MEQDGLGTLELSVLSAGAGGDHRHWSSLDEGAGGAVQEAEAAHTVLHASGPDAPATSVAVGGVPRAELVHVRDALDARCGIQRLQERRGVVPRYGEQVLQPGLLQPRD